MKKLRTAQLEKAKLLVRVPNWIGDAVMCLPALRELRRALPGAEIALVGRPWVLDVFPKEELRCRTIAYDTRHSERGILGRWRFASRMKRERFDAAILFQNAFDAALLAAMASIPVRAGYGRECRGILLTHAVEVPKDGEIPPHETYYYLELLRRLGLLARLPEVAEICLTTAAVDRSRARSELLEFLRQQSSLREATALDDANKKILIGIGAGASFGTAKRWPGERFASLAARVHRDLGATPVFFGSPEEADLVESLLPGAGSAARSLAGKTTLPDFIRLIPGCDLFITNDTGTMHVAAALGVPTIALFGPTDENGTRPLGAQSEVLAGVADCRPCKLRECPIDHRCMTSLSVDAVFEAARARLAANVVQLTRFQS